MIKYSATHLDVLLISEILFINFIKFYFYFDRPFHEKDIIILQYFFITVNIFLSR